MRSAETRLFTGTLLSMVLLVLTFTGNSYAQSTFDAEQTYQLSVSTKGEKKYLAISGGHVRRGVPAVLWDDVDQDDIRWTLEPVRGLIHKLKNRKTGLYMAVSGGSSRLGAKIVQWPDVGQRDIQWMVLPQPDGKYKLQNLATRRYLAVSGGRIVNGQEAVQWSDVGQADLIWNIEQDESTPGNELNLSSVRDAFKFGYRSQPKYKRVPLLVVLSEFQDSPLDQSLEFYDGMTFGPAFPNIVDQFQAYSGRTMFQRAGVVKILHRHSWRNIPDNFDAVVTRRGLASAGLNIEKFDTDDNNIISEDELAILSINSNLRPGGWPSGQMRDLITSYGGKRLKTLIASTHHGGDINLYAHELMHVLGNREDLYGPSSVVPRLNRYTTIMSLHDRRRTSLGPIFLDPYNRIRSGWLLPRVHFPTSTKTESLISAYPDAAFSRAPIILHDQNRSSDEFFIVEHRSPDLIPYDQGSNKAPGVAIWYVQVNDEGRTVDFFWPPPIVPLDSGGSMGANYIIGVGNLPATGSYWTEDDGTATLNWGDGSDSGFRIRVDSIDGREALIEYWRD